MVAWGECFFCCFHLVICRRPTHSNPSNSWTPISSSRELSAAILTQNCRSWEWLKLAPDHYLCIVSPPALLCWSSAFGKLLDLLIPILFLYQAITPFLIYPLAPLGWALFCSSFSTPTSVVIRCLSSGRTAGSFANRWATHLLSGRCCHSICSTWSSLLRTLLSRRHFLHLVYKWSTDCSACLQHQQSAVSGTPIFPKNTPIVPCPTLSWKNRKAYLFGACPCTGWIPAFR